MAEQRFTRADQLRMLERATLDSRPGVSAAAMKAVLRAIDDYGRGREAWPSQETLAMNCGYCVRHVARVVEALVEASLLVVERRGALTLNHYQIVWSELALRVRAGARPTIETTGNNGLEASPRRMGAPEACGSAGEDRQGHSEGVHLLTTKAEALGVFSSGVVVDAARRTSVEHVHAVLDYFAAKREQFEGAGALVTRLRRCREGLAVVEGWPPVRGGPVARPAMDEKLVSELDRARRLRAQRKKLQRKKLASALVG